MMVDCFNFICFQNYFCTWHLSKLWIVFFCETHPSDDDIHVSGTQNYFILLECVVTHGIHVYYLLPMALMYVSSRNGEWSLKMKFEPCFDFPWGSKNCQSALKLSVVCVTGPFLSLRGEELDAPASMVGMFTSCNTAQGWDQRAGLSLGLERTW